MRATIKRPDGTVIEAEGTAEEIAALEPKPAVSLPWWWQPGQAPVAVRPSPGVSPAQAPKSKRRTVRG